MRPPIPPSIPTRDQTPTPALASTPTRPPHTGRARWLTSTPAVTLFFVLLTIWFTLPQIAVMDSVYPHQDPLFSTWRLAWVAHQLPRAPFELLDTNILYPLKNTAAFSDAAPLIGMLGAPIIWLGAPPVVAYNVMLLASFVVAALGAFLLVRELTGSAVAGIVAGLVFGFSPFRFEHYWHLEIVWSGWIPMTLWAVHRTMRTGRWRDGLLAGLCFAAQVFCCIYLAVFLGTWLALIGVLLVVTRLLDLRSQAFRALIVGGIVAIVLVAPYLRVYMGQSRVVGTRSTEETTMYSAKVGNYLASPPSNLLYGWTRTVYGDNEKNLFPGVAAILLALVGLCLPLGGWGKGTERTARERSAAEEQRVEPSGSANGRPSVNQSDGKLRLVYAIAMLFAFDMSLGFNGLTFATMREVVPVYQGLRVTARAATLVQLGLAVLAGFGIVRLLALNARAGRSGRAYIGSGLVLVMGLLVIAEYTNRPLSLVQLPTTAPPLARWLRRQPNMVIAELPMPRTDRLPGEDPRYEFMSTFHWQKLVNGYSAFMPPRYGSLLDNMRTFPDERSIGSLRSRGVTHVIVHPEIYAEPAEARALIQRLTGLPDFQFLGWFPDGWGTAALFRLRPAVGPGRT